MASDDDEREQWGMHQMTELNSPSKQKLEMPDNLPADDHLAAFMMPAESDRQPQVVDH